MLWLCWSSFPVILIKTTVATLKGVSAVVVAVRNSIHSTVDLAVFIPQNTRGEDRKFCILIGDFCSTDGVYVHFDPELSCVCCQGDFLDFYRAYALSRNKKLNRKPFCG